MDDKSKLSSLFKKKDLFGTAGSASIIGFHLISGIIVGGVIGYFFDKWLGTNPWGKFFFLFMGIAAGFLNVYRDTMRLIRSYDNEALAKKIDAKTNKKN